MSDCLFVSLLPVLILGTWDRRLSNFIALVEIYTNKQIASKWKKTGIGRQRDLG